MLMLRACFYILQVGIFLTLSVWFADHPGKVKIDWLGYRIETYFSILIFLVVILMIVTIFVWRFFKAVLIVPTEFLSKRRHKRKEDGYKALALGMAAAAAGDRDETKRLAQRAHMLLEDPHLTRLLSAQSASLNGDEAAAVRYFNTLSENDDTAFIGLIGLMRQAIQEDDSTKTLKLAERAYRIRPDSAFVFETLFELQTREALWEEAQKTLFDAVRRKIIPESVAICHRTTILTARSQKLEKARLFDQARDFADRALSVSPEFVPAAIIRVRVSKVGDKQRKNAHLLEKVWCLNPHPELVTAYTELWPDDGPMERFKRVQKLTFKNQNLPESRLALANTALDCNLWGEARRYLKQFDDEEITVSVCKLMSRLEQGENGDIAAARSWLERASSARTDLNWTCEVCGAIASNWAPLCGNCGGFDKILWKQPPRIFMLPLSDGSKGESKSNSEVDEATTDVLIEGEAEKMI